MHDQANFYQEVLHNTCWANHQSQGHSIEDNVGYLFISTNYDFGLFSVCAVGPQSYGDSGVLVTLDCTMVVACHVSIFKIIKAGGSPPNREV